MIGARRRTQNRVPDAQRALRVPRDGGRAHGRTGNIPTCDECVPGFSSSQICLGILRRYPNLQHVVCYLEHVATVLEILRRDNCQAKMSKCAFAQEQVAYLGHVISAAGVATDELKIQTIRDWIQPTNLKEFRGFLGMSGYYQKFIRHYAIISQPLTALLKKGTLFVWTDATEAAFQALKQALISAPVLVLADFSQQFVVETDACDVGIGAILSQKGHPLAYVSRSLGPHNKGLSVYEKEYLAILLVVQQWRLYLQLGEFFLSRQITRALRI